MKSVIDTLGEEVTGIASPVTLCMVLTVALVRLLNPYGESRSDVVAIASLYYDEKAGDSSEIKFVGSLINALLFVAIVTCMTFVLVLLFKYGYTRWIYAYLGLAGFSTFFVLTGLISLQLIQMAALPLDVLSLAFILYNFSVVGVLALFFWPAPLTLKQGYLVLVGVVTAYMFTAAPEWTTWTLLGAMAVYDLGAVLLPGGPLKVLVELAIERDEDIPALVYEARPVNRGGRDRTAPLSTAPALAADDALALGVSGPAPCAPDPEAHGTGPRENAVGVAGPPPSAPLADQGEARGAVEGRSVQDQPSGQAASEAGLEAPGRSAGAEASGGLRRGACEVEGSSAHSGPLQELVQNQCTTQLAAGEQQQGRAGPLVASGLSSRPRLGDSPADGMRSTPQQLQHDEDDPVESIDEDCRPLIEGHAPGSSDADRRKSTWDNEEFGLPSSIKLGLGDFIFYSVLVGRAAMYDMLTVYAAYLGIMAGLGATLLLLAVAQRALPALPFSIALGAAFYACARLLLEPFVLPLSAALLAF